MTKNKAHMHAHTHTHTKSLSLAHTQDTQNTHTKHTRTHARTHARMQMQMQTHAHVRATADKRLCVSRVTGDVATDAKVAEFNFTAAAQQDVRRLDVCAVACERRRGKGSCV